MPHCLSEIVMWLPDFGGMHLKVFIIIIFKTGRGDRLNGGIWFSSSDHWRVKDGWRMLDRDLKSPTSNHAFQWDGSAWWMIFIEERKLKEACHCSHSLVFIGGTKALKIHSVPFTAVDISDEEFYHKDILCYVDSSLHLMVIYRLNTPQLWTQCFKSKCLLMVYKKNWSNFKVLKYHYRRQLSGIVISFENNFYTFDVFMDIIDQWLENGLFKL